VIEAVVEGVKATDADLKSSWRSIHVTGRLLMSPQDPYVLEAGRFIRVIGVELPSRTLASTDMNFQSNDGRCPASTWRRGAYGNTTNRTVVPSTARGFDQDQPPSYMHKLGLNRRLQEFSMD